MPDIAVWNKCNNKCVMCTNMEGFPDQDPAQYGLEWQIRKMERYLMGREKIYLKNADNPGFVNLTGGEPTMHPDFFKLLVYLRGRLPGVHITLLSNGRLFSDRVFFKGFLKVAKSPFTVGIPLHGASAALHDKVTGVRGAFAQTIGGLRNLLAASGGPRVELRLVLHRLNMAGLRGMLEFLRKTFPAAGAYRVVAIHYEIEGRSLENHPKLSLRLSTSARAVNSAAALIKAFPDFRIYHFPLCLISGKLRSRCWITLPPEDRVYPAKCDRCALRAGCPGLMKEYYKKFGDGELTSVIV